MNTKRYMRNQVTGVLAVLTGMLAIAAQSLFGASSHYIAANNYDAAVDIHCHSLSRTNDVAVTSRHLLWREGATAGSTVALNGAANSPLGTIDNIEANTGEYQKVILLGKEQTVKMVASAAMAIGANVYTAANGKIQGSATLVAGTYFHIGRLLTAAGADGDVVEVESIVPRKVNVVANAASLATTQAAMQDGAIVIVLAA